MFAIQQDNLKLRTEVVQLKEIVNSLTFAMDSFKMTVNSRLQRLEEENDHLRRLVVT